jgi:hypothetical protein
MEISGNEIFLAQAVLSRNRFFPGTATVESDFGVLKWEFDEYILSLSDFSVEAIMQCKQFKRLTSMHHSRPSTI